MDFLKHVVVIADGDVVQPVVAVFHSGEKFGRHEKEPLHRMSPLRSGRDHNVGSPSVCIRIHLRSVVALARRILGGAEHRDMVGVVSRPDIKCCLDGMNVVLCLFRNHCHVRLKVKAVSSTAVFVGVVVFESQTCVIVGAQETSRSYGLGLELRHFRESIAVMVISVAVATLPVDEDACSMVVGDNGSIERGVVVERARRADGCQRMGYAS